MQQKVLTADGQKAYQRTDKEDRALIYRDWIRTVDTNGFFIDIDFIKWRNIAGKLTPVAITDLTRTDSDFVSQKYLDAIITRFMFRDKQGALLKILGEKLNIPVYLVLFPKSMNWVQVYSFQKKVWKEFSPDNWVEYLKTL